MLPLYASEIINRVHHDDLQREEARVKQERDARKMLRLQAGNTGMTSSELLKRLAGSEEEAKGVPDVEVPKESRNEPKPQSTGFPPPPKSRGEPSKGS